MKVPRSPIQRLAWALAGSLAIAFAFLAFAGSEVYRQAPPIPDRVVTDSGRLIATADQILDGQQVWQTTGGQQLGSVWGHGAYQAPDWSADWLHREALALLEVWSRAEHGVALDALDAEERAGLEHRLIRELRTNRYDAASGTLTISEDRARAIAAVAAHYDGLYGGAPALTQLRDDYAMREVSVPDAERRQALTTFFFWTAWAATTERPGSNVTYTNNWPHEPLVANRPTGTNLVWSMVSIVLLLAGIGGLTLWRASRKEPEPEVTPPDADPIAHAPITPSMRFAGYYVAVVVGLFVVQVLLGALTAHYTVEGQALFGLPIGELLPYSLTRTWHIQTAMFWIATAFLATGLFLAPMIGGREPRGQKAGVVVLLGALVVVVVGSLAGEWFAIQQKLPLDASFWIGHQGYEYVELGRVFQLALFGGLILWLVLVLRGIWPALLRRDDGRTLAWIFTGAAVAIGLLYGAGLFYGARTHLSVMEYWRWWVVHLWVEGFFEVFATAATGAFLARLGLVNGRHAGAAVIASTALFLFAGVPGTLHHLYFSGTPPSVMAIGASFSALEVVPLTLIGFEAIQTLRHGRAASWMVRYRWPIRFLVGVAFWNLVGAGLFGFLINPPIALYYMQGLNTTPVHAHAATFGVYGLLSLALMLVIARRLTGDRVWNERALALGFWGMNGGLALMIGLSLLPIGLAQTWASVEHGLWYARSAEFLQQDWIRAFRWARMVGDVVFLAGVGCFTWFVAGLRTGWSLGRDAGQVVAAQPDPPARPSWRPEPAPSHHG